MATQQDTMRKLINLLEAVESAPDTGKETGKAKVPPASPEEEKAAAKFAQTITAISESQDEPVDEDWKKVAGALAVAGAALVSNLSHAADPGRLIDKSSPVAAAQSCSIILDAVVKTGKFSPQVVQQTRYLSDKSQALANQLINDRPDRGQAWNNDMQVKNAVANQLVNKANQMLKTGDTAPWFEAATECAKAVNQWNVKGYLTNNI